MTAKQFERRIKKMFRSQSLAAEAMGVTQASVSHWITGTHPVPAIAVKLLECLGKDYRPSSSK